MRFFRWLKCRAGHHQYFVKQVVSEQARKVGCHCCDREWAMHIGDRIIVPWTLEFDAFYGVGVAAQAPT